MQAQQVVALQGGLDLVSPGMMVRPGFCIAAENYEPEARGYRRLTGYERFDGHPKPSAADYWVVPFTAGDTEIEAGDVVEGGTSGAIGTALEDATLESGAYGDGDAMGFVVLYNVSGAFEDAEDLEVSSTVVAVVDGDPVLNGATDDETNAGWIADVTALRRAAIAAPTGTGPIRGVATYKGDVYCWRDSTDETHCKMWKATTGGWVEQTFGWALTFTAGTTAFLEGETLTGGTSGATATIRRVIQNAGAWSGTASGYLVLSNLSGPFNNGETITSASGSATSGGTGGTGIKLNPGGRYRSVVANFYATGDKERLYFVNGVDRAHEWDGTTLSPIRTRIPQNIDMPTHVAVHRNHLFLSFPFGSITHSSTLEPLVFNATTGAGEIGFGEAVTGLQAETRDSLIITGRSKIGYLVGADATEFDLRSISESSGAIEDTLQIVGKPMFMDNLGIRDLTAAQVFGDWNLGSLTQMVEPLLAQKRRQGVTPVGSFRVRSKNQYRLYFSDSTGIIIYFGRKNPEIMPVALGFTPTCFHSGEDASGNEVLLAGGDDGMVYELDRGTSFDGDPIQSFIRFAFMNQGAPNVVKRYHRARLEGRAEQTPASLSAVADFTYGSDVQPASAETDFEIAGSGGWWDQALWNEFNWSAQVEGQAEIELSGIGENVSVAVLSESAVESGHVLSTLTINYTPRRKIR